MNSCKICDKLIEVEEHNYVVQIWNKGAAGINNASKTRRDIFVNHGDFVLKSCRKRHINKADIVSSSSQKDGVSLIM